MPAKHWSTHDQPLSCIQHPVSHIKRVSNEAACGSRSGGRRGAALGAEQAPNTVLAQPDTRQEQTYEVATENSPHWAPYEKE